MESTGGTGNERHGKAPLFDTNAHPDEAIRRGLISSYGAFAERARGLGWIGAAAVALPETDPRFHARMCAEDPDFFFPVAPWRSGASGDVVRRFSVLVDAGFRAVKVHPRFGGPAFSSDEFRQLAACSASSQTVLFVCTYPFGPARSRLGDHILDDLEQALADNPGLRLVLLHGGGPDLLRYAEFARANPAEVLIDLSLTLMKYRGSSIDLDIAFLVEMFDQRISFGSDYPWYTPEEVAQRVAYFVKDTSQEKAANSAHHSAMNFLGITGRA